MNDFLSLFRTPGIAKALRALGAKKRQTRSRVLAGKKPIIGGKKVTTKAFARKTSTTVARIKAGGPAKPSRRKSAAAIKRRWGSAAVGGKKKGNPDGSKRRKVGGAKGKAAPKWRGKRRG